MFTNEYAGRKREELCYGPPRKDVAMHRFLSTISSLAAIVSAVCAMGCSSSSPAPAAAAGACAPATVSFKSDVIPVFQMSCTLTSVCHGQMGNVGEESLYLGENQGATDANAVYGMLVGVPAKEDPSMPLVTANSTDNSYLYHKLLGDQNTLAAGCMKAATMCSPDCNPQQPCGGLMPYSGELLSQSDPAFLCTIKNWIDTGAQNN